MRNATKSMFFLALASVGVPVFAADPHAAAVRVAIYDDGGGGGDGPTNVERCLGKLPGGFTYRRVKAEDIRAGVLKEVDVLVQPGGSGSKQAEQLKPEGRDAIRDFVTNGGGYLGICAGSYLATTDYTWSLGLLNAKVVDRQHWARGTGNVRIKLTDDGKALLDAGQDTYTVFYGQGPLLAPGTRTDLPAFKSLALFETEMTRRGPEGVMKGTTAIAAAPFGKGRVICISPHPEKTGGPDDFIRRSVNWVAGRDESTTTPPDAPPTARGSSPGLPPGR